MEAIQGAWESALDEHAPGKEVPGTRGLMEMVKASLSKATLGNYADKFSIWVKYATQIRNPPVPYLTPVNYLQRPDKQVRQEDVHLYLGWLRETKEHSINPRNFPQYVSAINSIHILCHVPPPVPFEFKGTMAGKLSRGGVRLDVENTRAQAPDLNVAGRRYGHDIWDEDQLDCLLRWAELVTSPHDLRVGAMWCVALLYFARSDTVDGVFLDHFHWSPAGVRFFESKHKKHAETVGARVLFTPWKKCHRPLMVLQRYTE